MKKLSNLLSVIVVGALCSACDDFSARDSIANVASASCTVHGEFASGRTRDYVQQPETFATFTAMERGAVLPVLTNIAVTVNGRTHLFNASQIAKLRSVDAQRLDLVVYDSGLAIISPEVLKSLKRLHRARSNVDDFIEVLREGRESNMRYTQEILTQ